MPTLRVLVVPFLEGLHLLLMSDFVRFAPIRVLLNSPTLKKSRRCVHRPCNASDEAQAVALLRLTRVSAHAVEAVNGLKVLRLSSVCGAYAL